ncbi:MAG TPA: CHAT domain-containing protein, partial [Blastocatellia bacterium]|nr:CHAT domain-containing protein [Blastocatellia bacterium]
AVSAWERSGKKVAAAQARSKIAYIQFLRGNYNEALARYYVVRDQLEALGSSSLVAWCNLEIAEVLLALNSFADAIDSAEAARSRFSETGLQYESAQASMVKALAEMGLQQFEPARDVLEEARAVFEKNENTTFVALIDSYLGELALKAGDGSEALRRAESSLRLFTRQKLPARAANSRRIAAWAAYLSGDQTRALRFAKSALRTAGPRVQPAVAYQCHHLIGKIERDRGRRALESFRRAVQAVEGMRGGVVADEFKATFLRDKIEVYEDAISVCLDEGGEGRIEEAFRLVESSKSRALADLLARYVKQATAKKSRSTSKGAQADARALLVKLIEDLNWYNSKAGLEDNKGGQRKAAVAERYQQKVQRCERQIAQLFRRLDGGQGQAFENQTLQTAEAGLLCRTLEAGETAIEYFTTGDEISAFILSPDRIRVERGIASKREVERLLAGLRFQLEKFNYGPAFADEHFEQLHRAANQHLGRLHELIFAALEPLIEGDRLIIMPHGALHYVPFHALLDRSGYLIDRFEISYAPSAMVLNLCRQRSAEVRAKRPGFNGGHPSGSMLNGSNSRRDVGKVVAFGIGDRDAPNIDHEVSELRAIFPDAVTLTGGEATRSNLMKFAPKARYLHLASHGYFRRDNPMFSFLKLADASLHFYNLLDLKLDAELVTLSACHTGVNMIFPGDELHGLMRGFLYAGAPSLVASLWAANDISTAAFMRRMYMRISEGDSKRAALRAAQLAVKDEYGHPYYWAPFVLMGNPN